MTSEELSEVFHRIFHDVGNPITSIISYSNLIEQSQTLGLTNEKISAYSNSIGKEAWKVNRLLEVFLLLVSKKDSLSTIKLGDVKKTVLNRYSTRYGLGEIDINFLNFNQDTLLIGETDQLCIIFSEIISNAFGAISYLEDKNDLLTVDIDTTFCEQENENFIKIDFKNRSKKHQIEITNLKKIGVSEFPRFNKPSGIGLQAISTTLEKWGGKLEISEEVVNNQDYNFHNFNIFENYIEMTILPIKIYPDNILRKVSEPVHEINEEIFILVDDMVQTMYDAPGIGLAAPQVGVSKRLFVINLGKDSNSEKNDDSEKKSDLHIFINPIITETKGKMKYEEGCLSIPDIREYVTRPSWLKIKATDLQGKDFELEAEGLLAICIQHELDHLNGVLFIDHLQGLKKKMISKKLSALENRS